MVGVGILSNRDRVARIIVRGKGEWVAKAQEGLEKFVEIKRKM